MSLTHKIDEDLKSAMKSKDMVRMSVLRMAKSAFGVYQIEKKKNSMDDSEVLEVLQKQSKQRRESLESFLKAGRQDLADKEKQELEILDSYLPAQLSDEELRALILGVIEHTEAKTKADTGKVMKELMPAVKGKADGKRVNEILCTLLP